MSSDEDRSQSITVPAKKRRVQRACDICRRKRRACDGLRMSEKKCTNCIESGMECTFSGAIARRRSYVESLEARLELTEQLLSKMPPPQAPIVTTSASSPASSQWSSDSPILKHQLAAVAPPVAGPGVELAALTIRSMNTPAPSPHGDDIEHIKLAQDMSDLSINNFQERFHGKSSGAMLVKAAVLARQRYEEKEMPWTSRRMHYWTYNPTKDKIPHVGPYVFPESDLLFALIDLFFANWNIYYPLLHRPTFERSIADGLHTRDTSFGAIVLLVCAIGSRFSDDVRVCPPETEPLRCGWQYFDQLSPTVDQVFVRPTLYQIQYYCLAPAFLEFSVPGACWTLIGIGIRMAQDVGAHRANNLGKRPTIESELWKRAFWVLICMDRLLSSALGRPCTTQYEDFDVELPIEVDDEFWDSEDPSCAFKQPAGKPSQITFFNCFIRLNNLWAFSLKMLYSLNKAKELLAVRDAAWEEHIAVELDSALNGWVDSIPPHLRWNPTHRDDVFFDQSALLYCSYYQLQTIIHRPFIPMIRKGASTTLPSLAICTNAARSCSHVADISKHRKNGKPVPVLLSSTFTSALVLLLNVWSGKYTGLPPHMNTAVMEVHKVMANIQVCEKRWQSAGLSWDLLYELAVIGQLPLPTPQQSPPAPAPTSARPTPAPNSIKRAREDDPVPHSAAALAPYPPYRDTYPTLASTPSSHAPLPQTPAPAPFPALPTYTADLGRLPVFHPYAQSSTSTGSSWYPAQTSAAPLGYPDFAGGTGIAGGGSADAFDAGLGAFAPSASGGYAGGGVDFGVGADGIMSSDAMAMWSSAPTGFELDDWGTYFSAMSELHQGMATSGAGA
ncbi:fungal-specific transcription factor domain-containing protein [Mycena epipterygia]|nr:fungal-specific transcription factor domain-containing protein [Mycena epipterygia]